jgi:hypothetical protein
LQASGVGGNNGRGIATTIASTSAAASTAAPRSEGTVATPSAFTTGEDSKPAAATVVVAKQEAADGAVAEARTAATTTTTQGDSESVPALAALVTGVSPVAAKDVPVEKVIASPAFTATGTVDNDDDAKPAARVVNVGKQTNSGGDTIHSRLVAPRRQDDEEEEEG